MQYLHYGDNAIISSCAVSLQESLLLSLACTLEITPNKEVALTP
jgi:hypothetical protein